jgi:NADH dehydrogenase/NADH:ubiquinone oxidoreductase subunit G
MSTPGPLFRPFTKLVKITVKGRVVEVPENNMVLRALQYVAGENIAYGRFCWNEECQYCRITFDMGEGTPSHTAISCKLMVQDGMRITQMDTELRYCLREIEAAPEKK